MRTVACDGLGAVSALGFGCASLGSRISAATGARAVERALDAGVTWFDVAPSYGDGAAETILGDALRGVPAQIVTKAGLAAPPKGLLKRVAGAVARPVVAALPGLRPLVKRLRPDGARRVALDAETVRVGLLRSLERLRRDAVAVLALHDPSTDDVRDEAVIRALCDLKDEGLAALIGVAGTPEAIRAAERAGLPVDVAQTAHSPFAPGLRPLLGMHAFTVTHSVFGVGGALAALKTAAKRDTALLERLGYDDLPRLLLDYAFAANPRGVVIASSFAEGHLAANVAAASRAPVAGLVEKVDAALAGR